MQRRSLRKCCHTKKTKKFHYVFLKNINELLSATLDNKEIAELEKEISNQYNNKLKANHKKKKGDTVKINMKEEYGNEEGDDYYEDDDDYNNYTNFK
mmetsp:Transcript_13799/g.14355  ORF Transcript_13799/g.14355 Transcript_13799/m.14355 type:complete len:97 (+) Transcript_13799:78-368(+)